MIRRVLLLAAIVLVALLAETTVLAPVRIGGARPDLVVLATVAVAMAAGAETGAAFGFAAGLAGDLLLALPVGVGALAGTLIGYAVGAARPYLAADTLVAGRALPVALCGVATLLAQLLTGSLLHVLSGGTLGWGGVARTAALAALLNLLLAVPVYPLVHRLVARAESARVVRW